MNIVLSSASRQGLKCYQREDQTITFVDRHCQSSSSDRPLFKSIYNYRQSSTTPLQQSTYRSSCSSPETHLDQSTTMKITPLAFLTIFAASSSAFGLNGGAKSVARSTLSGVSFKKPSALVQPVDIQGNRLSTTSVSSVPTKYQSDTNNRLGCTLFVWVHHGRKPCGSRAKHSVLLLTSADTQKKAKVD
jgi:hypothetical protein